MAATYTVVTVCLSDGQTGVFHENAPDWKAAVSQVADRANPGVKFIAVFEGWQSPVDDSFGHALSAEELLSP